MYELPRMHRSDVTFAQPIKMFQDWNLEDRPWMSVAGEGTPGHQRAGVEMSIVPL